MKTVLTILVVISMFGTLGVLFAGMVGMARKDHDPRRSNRLMRWRVVMQGITLALFALLMLMMKS